MKMRIIALALLAVMLLGIFAGCTQTTPNPTTKPSGDKPATGNFTVPEGGYDGSAVTINFYHTMGANLREVLDNYIVEFNKLYPNITIVHDQVGGYDDVRDQISKEILAGNQPHIAYCYPDHVAMYNSAEAVTTLDGLIASTIEVTRADGTKEILGLTDEQKADFIPGYYNEGKQFGDGLMYTLPLSKSTEVLYYNKTFFDEHNLTVPTTWDELEAVCAKIKEIDPTSIPLGYDSESNWFITMCEQLQSPYTSANGDHFLFDNETNREFVERFNGWFQKGYLTTQTLYKAYTSGLFVAQEGTRSYMSIGSSAGATHQRPTMVNGEYPFEVGIATVPQADANNKKVISQGPSLCIFQKANPQEVIASWLFVKFLTTTVEFQAEFALASGYVPVLKSVSQHPVYAAELEKANGGDFITSLAAKVCLEQADFYYTSPAFVGSSVARTQVGNLIANCLTMTGSDVKQQIAQAFQDAIDECEYQAG
jgi:multiple sugar transport system substrate-binding protein